MAIPGVDAKYISNGEIVIGSLDHPDLISGSHIALDDATLHDTSVKMIERSYSRFIASHSDEIARRALLEIQQPSAPNVVPLSKGR